MVSLDAVASPPLLPEVAASINKAIPNLGVLNGSLILPGRVTVFVFSIPGLTETTAVAFALNDSNARSYLNFLYKHSNHDGCIDFWTIRL